MQKLLDVWENFSVEQVYRADSIGVLRSGARWLSLLSFGWLLRKWRAAPPSSLLDNTPLAGLLHRMLDLPRLDAALADGLLHALAVTASSYTVGHHITFYQTADESTPWVRMHRIALQDQIGVEHLLASSAIPFIFPAVPLYLGGHLEYCGDGSMRQLAPISPAIHLGATKVLVVGAGRMNEPVRAAPQSARYPSLAQIAGHAMSSIFLDSLAVDIERLNRINATLSMMPPEHHAQDHAQAGRAAGDRAVRAARRHRRAPRRQPAARRCARCCRGSARPKRAARRWPPTCCSSRATRAN